MSPPTVSVVIPLYQDASSIAVVLNALNAQESAIAFEIIVVDDGSMDSGPEIAKAAGVTLLSQANAGPAAARNAGADRARGSIILYLDADCVPPRNWLDDMSAQMLTGGFDAVVGTICPANDGVVPRLIQSEVADRYRTMAHAFDGVDFIAAPSCGTTRALRERLGGFDETLRQAEDVEMGYRISQGGGRIAFVKSAPVAHHHQTTWQQFMCVKYRRAMGRIEVLNRYPDKRRADDWTPLQFKVQVGAIGLAGIALALALLMWSLFWVMIACALGGVAVILGWPQVKTTAVHMRGLVQWPVGHVIGIGFVLARAVVIIAGVITHKLRRVMPRRTNA